MRWERRSQGVGNGADEPGHDSWIVIVPRCSIDTFGGEAHLKWDTVVVIVIIIWLFW